MNVAAVATIEVFGEPVHVARRPEMNTVLGRLIGWVTGSDPLDSRYNIIRLDNGRVKITWEHKIEASPRYLEMLGTLLIIDHQMRSILDKMETMAALEELIDSQVKPSEKVKEREIEAKNHVLTMTAKLCQSEPGYFITVDHSFHIKDSAGAFVAEAIPLIAEQTLRRVTDKEREQMLMLLKSALIQWSIRLPGVTSAPPWNYHPETGLVPKSLSELTS